MSDRIDSIGDWEEGDPEWEHLMGPVPENDIEISTEVTITYDGDERDFWEHALAWGNSVFGGLAPAYNILVLASNMRSTRSPMSACNKDGMAAETEFGEIIESLSGSRSPFLTVLGFTKGASERFPFEVSFAYPKIAISSHDMPARDWLVETAGKPTECLLRMMYVSEEEYELLSGMLEKNDDRQGE